MRNSINNPSAASWDNGSLLAFGHSEKFFLKDLRNSFLIYGKHFSRSSLFAGINYRGSSLDNDLATSLAYSLQTSKNSFTAFQIVFSAENFVSDSGIKFHTYFIIYSFSHSHKFDKIKISAIVKSLQVLSRKHLDLYPSFAFSYDISEQYRLYMSILENNFSKLDFNLGLTYHFQKISIGFGLNTKELLPSLSISFKIKDLELLVSGAYHQYLGYETSFSSKLQ